MNFINNKYRYLISGLLAIGVILSLTAARPSDELDVNVTNPVDESVKTNKATIGETIVLDKDNTLVIRTPFMDEFFVDTYKQIVAAANETRKPLYVVIYSPGGSVVAGNNLIQALQGLKRPVHTVTMFAASMGFQTVQQLGTRYILPNGTLMSHQMAGGVEGSFGSNLNSRVDHAMRMSDRLDEQAAKRMGISLKKYKELVAVEYWRDGQDAVKDKSADKIAHIVCTKALSDSIAHYEAQTMFGMVKVNFSACPLLTIPLIEAPVGTDVQKQETIKKNVQTLFGNQEYMYKNYIRFNRPIDLTADHF